MKKVSYLVDENGNKWTVEYFNVKEAEKLSKSLIDCHNCVDCKNCSYCNNCKDCESCVACEVCVNCDACDSCEFCANCKSYIYGFKQKNMKRK